VDRVPPGPADAFRHYEELEERFAQGSACTRFRRRNDPEEQWGKLLHLPSSEVCEPGVPGWS
jgi:hypothetical protein